MRKLLMRRRHAFVSQDHGAERKIDHGAERKIDHGAERKIDHGAERKTDHGSEKLWIMFRKSR
ncbi:MAG: hypothetical protein ILM98_00825 [Kiritimatiellae bacterium]|nr:hypothetical protein [Kiritimatiellia bacterium]